MAAAAPTNQMSASGFNLLRTVLASYFIGVSLGLINGTNVTALAHLVLPGHLAVFVANTAVFILAYLVLMGMWLRPAALLLAAWVLACSAYVTFDLGTSEAASDFWRDLALIAGLMMTYLQSSIRNSRHRAMVRFAHQPRKIKPKEPVHPRRVALNHKIETRRPEILVLEDTPSADVINIFAA